MDKNDIIEYVMHTPHNTNRAVLSSMLNQLTEGGGGGGSSDFSTAKLTVNGTTYGRISAPVISPSPTGHSLFPMLTGQGEYDIVIYTGGTVLTYDGDGTFSVSGNIQDVGGNSYLVTGDCTITISAPQAIAP